MIELSKLFKKMSTDLNYVKKTEPLSFKLIDSSDGSIHHNVIEMLKDEILDLAFFSGKGDSISSEEKPEEEDSLEDENAPQFEGDDAHVTDLFLERNMDLVEGEKIRLRKLKITDTYVNSRKILTKKWRNPENIVNRMQDVVAFTKKLK